MSNLPYCVTCKTIKNLSPKPYSKFKDGRVGGYYMCRSCNTERAKKYRKTETGAANIRKASYKSIGKHQKKQQARLKLNYAVNSGKVTKPTLCEECQAEKRLDAHHEDYLKPLAVRWLCRQCHATLHNSLRLVDIALPLT